MPPPSRPKREASDTNMRNIIVGFLLIYGVGQVLLLLQSTGMLSAGDASSKSGGSASSVTAETTDSGAAGLRGGGALDAAASAALVSAAGVTEIPLVYGRVEELPFPELDEDDGGVSIFDVLPASVVEAGEARQALLNSRKKEDKEKDKGGKYDGQPVTVGVPCWTDHRLLWRMGLDSMAEEMDGGSVPVETRRSRTPHAHSELVSDLSCTFHSTPISGGLQCCCSSNTTIPYNSRPAAPDPGTFFCLPSTVVVGARHSGAGLLAAFFQQHAYLRFARAPPPHVMSSVRSLFVVDSVMPRYLSHYSTPSYLPDDFLTLPREGRPKGVSPYFWVDSSPSYFYGINVSP
jgi:hypothetical protein